MKAVVLLLAVFCMGQAAVFAQGQEKHNARGLMGANSEGTRFIVGFMENEDRYCSNDVDQRIMVASRFQNSVTIRMPNGGGGIDLLQFALAADELRSIDIPGYYECLGEGVYRKGIEIVSDRPICVYCYSSKPLTSDGYMALPVSSWGMQYVTANYNLDHYTVDPFDTTVDNNCRSVPRRGEFAVIASENNTAVTVYPSTPTLTGAGMITQVLNKGEILQIQDGGTIRGRTDITGSVVTSDKPVGLLSGHMRAGMPYELDHGKDHLIEMVPPRNALGRRHILVPFRGRQGGDIVRIISAMPDPTTVVIATATGSITRKIDNLGGFVEYELGQVAIVTTDHPVLVAQYSKSLEADPRNFRQGDEIVSAFDPDMVIVTPEEQFVQAALFETIPNFSSFSTRPQYEHHYVTLVAERAKYLTLKLNGQPVISYPGYAFGDIVGTPFVWLTLEVGDGRVHLIEGDALFGGYVYGLGQYDSYAWPVGAGLRKFDIVDSTKPRMADSLECSGAMVMAYETGPFEDGLRKFWMDSAGSTNVNFKSTPLMLGDEYAEGHVTLKDPRLPGHARIIAEDQRGNRDTLELDVQADRVLSFSPDAVLLSNVLVDQTYPASVIITNPNKVPMTLDQIRLVTRREFVLAKNYKGAVIAPGGSLQIDILFKTIARRNQVDTIIIESACQLYAIPMRADVTSPKIATHDLEFGVIRTGTTKGMKLRVWNSGEVPLTIESAVLNGGPFELAAPFAGPKTLDPGAAETLDVIFKPIQNGDFSATVSFYSNADSVAVAHLHGRSVFPAVKIGGHDYGRMQVGDSACAEIFITNYGGDTAHITGVLLDDPKAFVADPSVFPRNLAAGDTMWVKICFGAGAEQSYTSGILPLNTDGLEDRNTLLGAGYRLRGWISGYDWHQRWLGSSYNSTVYVHNVSSSPLTITKIWIADGDIGDFKVDPLPGPVEIAAGDMLPVNVSFSPMLPGLRACKIYASTNSRETPLIDSVLQGFALVALASDSLKYDGSTAYACTTRAGSLTIYNDGNTGLSLKGLALSSTPPLVKLNGTYPDGLLIGPGESLLVNFSANFAGYVGKVEGALIWGFAEIPDPISRPFSFVSEPQEYMILAATPSKVNLGNGFDLEVDVVQAHWRNLGQQGVELRVVNNPTMARFDLDEWKRRTAGLTAGWVPTGDPIIDTPGIVVIRFGPVGAASLPLDDMKFPALPYQGFLGNSQIDTFKVSMTPAETLCSPPAFASVAYVSDSLCGLSNRLIQLTGSDYALKQSRPNPSGTTTIIEFTLGLESETRLELFTSDGQLLRTMIDGMMPAGTYSFPVDVRTIPSGLYYYRLTSGPYGAVRSMTVAK